MNYGNLVSNNKNLVFDSLDYGLYKLNNGNFKIISNDGNDLLKHHDGIYYVPRPGCTISTKFNKNEIYNVIDSVSKLTNPPNYLTFDIVY